mgnify:CR=1 FL=1
MKSQFIQDVEAFAKEMAVRLPKTHEGGIIIKATDNNNIAKCIKANPSHRIKLVEHMLTDEKIQSDVLEIISEYDSE